MTKTDFYLPFFAAALGAWLLSATAGAQTLPGGGVLEPLGGGLAPVRQLELKATNGPFQVVTGRFTLPPGGEVDWHGHPGMGFITVAKGMFDESREDGCVSLYGPGDVLFEFQGEVHRIANPSATETSEGLITFFLPVGSDPVTFVPPPAERPCSPTQGPGDDEPSADLAEIKATLDANTAAIEEVQRLLNRVARALSLNP